MIIDMQQAASAGGSVVDMPLFPFPGQPVDPALPPLLAILNGSAPAGIPVDADESGERTARFRPDAAGVHR